MKELFVSLFAVFHLASFAQVSKPISFDLEAGFNVRRGDECPQWRARSSARYYNWWADDCCIDDILRDGVVRNFYLGFKPEFEVFRILSVDAGLRITGTRSCYSPNQSIYWLAEQKGVNTHYVRIAEANQRSAWLGIPVDLRLVPCGLDNTSVYVKCGVAFSWRLWTKNSVVLYRDDDYMQERYADVIENQISAPDNFALPIWLGVGIQFGRRHAACIELTVPYFVRHAQMSSLVRIDHSAFGLQFTYRFPSLSNPRI